MHDSESEMRKMPNAFSTSREQGRSYYVELVIAWLLGPRITHYSQVTPVEHAL